MKDDHYVPVTLHMKFARIAPHGVSFFLMYKIKVTLKVFYLE